MDWPACSMAESLLAGRSSAGLKFQLSFGFCMAALGLDQVLNLAQQYGARDALEPRAPAVAVARGGSQTRWWRPGAAQPSPRCGG